MKLKLMPVAVALLTVVGVAYADPIEPIYTSFGAQPTFTFGGSGIPNDAVAVRTYTEGTITFTMGLTATPRFSSPALTNDGAGTFTAQPGESGPGLSLWNIGIYTNAVSSQSLPAGVTYRTLLRYDILPGVDTDLSAHGRLRVDNPFTTPSQASQNMGFSFWGINGSLGPNIANFPTLGTFDPNATGEYTFQLSLVNDEGFEVANSSVAIKVNVGTAAVPLPGTVALLGLGLIPLALRRKQRG